MLEGTSQIRDKVHNTIYDRNGYSSFDVEAVVAKLREDPKFKKFSDAQLYEYAYGLNEVHNMHVLKGSLQSSGFDTGKPKDPFWSQYTYEEILNMVNDGVMVPQEFIDWANTMQDSDTVAYQIEGTSDDENAYANLDAETDNIQKTDIQKRAQAFSSKAEAQQELIENKCEEVKPQVNQVLAERNELEQNHKMSLKKVETITSEWKTLDRKFKNGEELTESEQKKYKELGLLLNDSSNSLLMQAQKVSGDIEDLMEQINNIDMLLSVNERINAEIEDVGTRMASFEGNKRHIILPTSSGNQVTGMTAAFYAASMGNNLAFDAGLTGINLFFNNLEVQQELDSNIHVANTTTEQVYIVNQNTDKRDENTKTTTNNQTENQGDDKNTDDSRLGAPDYKPENPIETEDITKTSQSASAEETTSSEAATDSETETVAGFSDIVNKSAKNDIKVKAQLESKITENTQASTPSTVSAIPANTNSATASQTSETNETAAATEASSDTAVTETTENNETSVETEDPLQAETSQYVSECENRNNSMQIAEQQIQPKIEQIKNVRARHKQEDAVAKAELDKSIKEYEKLANKVKNGDELTDNEQKRVKLLEKALDSKNGTIIAAMRGKINALTGFATELENDIQDTVDNQKYGEEAIAKGKECAIAMYGDRSYLKNSMIGFMHFSQLSKEEQYDMLYGKAGESIGRDAIDNGELLVNNAAASNARLSKSLPLAGFAQNYANVLNQRITETNQKVSSIKTSLKNSVNQNTTNTTSESSLSSKKNEKETMDKTDAGNIKQKGNNIKQEGKEAQREGQAAKKEKTKTEKDSKKETNELKKTAATISKLNTESLQLNQSIQEMNAEAETLNSELQSKQSTQMVFNSNAQTSSAGALNAVSSSSDSGEIAAKTERLQAISTQSELHQNKITLNGKNIKVMNSKNSKKVKQLQKNYTKRHKSYTNRAKRAEEKEDENNKFQTKVNSAAKIFNGIMLTGTALMAMPWSHAVGQVMFHTGAYGTAACYVTNAAIYAANGNLKGAFINIGAAALSFLAAGGAAVTAMGSVSQLAAQAGTSTAVATAVIAATGAGAAYMQMAADKQLQPQTEDEKGAKSKKQRRLVSYQEKRSREAKMDKVDHTKKVLMNRGKKR